ncbi:DUF58 domain-containing protein [Segeticoccus rhizosphaerae]|jgi:uncharacterized protein (DUF58 family)|uniref:DUF58 domain-containing protein n=1 Tax=Segeticoccus rhizosphaerae TaxID=1104777 RepID=UPI0010C12C68|nr:MULTISPECIES: DUF58 domain-containing protein [Intrasporangiaceae]HEX5427500.1 DUF58 domain-containing protein [Pedococcus sp.]
MALTGRAVVLVLLGLAPVVARPTVSTVGWWWLFVILVIGLDWLLAVPPGTLVVSRGPVRQVRLGETTSTSLLVTNPSSRRFRGLVRDAWQPSAGATGERHTVRLRGGERTRLTSTLRPTRRGDRLADRVTVRSLGPLRVAARQQSFSVPGAVRALPAFASRKHLPSRLAQLRQLDGRSAVRTRGHGTEFDSLRTYVEGDDVRSIDWRATARRQSVVVRTWQPERDRRIILVLDTSRTSAARVADMPRLDAEMDAALLLAALASRAGDRVDLLAGDRRVKVKVSGSRNHTQLLHELVTAMAPLEPALLEANWTTLAAEVNRLSRRRSLVVLLTSLEPAAIEEGLLPVLPMLTAHHRVVLASVADPALGALTTNRSTTSAVYDAAAATRTVALRQRTAEALGRVGVTVLDEVPDELPVALVDHYLLLKSRGLL